MTPFALPVDKAEDVWRVMVVGGSLAQGDPDPAYSVSRFLELMLKARFPSARFEVVNGGITAVNSWVIRHIVSSSADLDIDLWVVLLGNNEVVGPFGAASDNAPLARRPGWVRLRTELGRLRVVQMVERVTGGLREADDDAEWTGMEGFLERRLRANDPQLEQCYLAFRTNLESIRGLAAARGEEVLLCTVPVNLADCPTFAFALGNLGITLMMQGRHGEAAEIFERARVQRPNSVAVLANLALARRRLGQKDDASRLFERVLEIEPEHVAALVQLGTIYRDEGREARARELLTRALALAPDDAEAKAVLDGLDAARPQSGGGTTRRRPGS